MEIESFHPRLYRGQVRTREMRTHRDEVGVETKEDGECVGYE